MKVYAKLIWITGTITFFSFAIALLLHCLFQGQEAEFWCNVALAIFGSALLSVASAGTTYKYEKRRQMEEFSKATKSILRNINKYNTSWNDEEKILFFLSFDAVDITTWDGYIRDIFFFFDLGHKKREYIYEKIYSPLAEFINIVSAHERHFRYHREAVESNPAGMRDGAVMREFISEIEDSFIEKKEYKETDSDGKQFIMTETSNKLVHSILIELNDKYYDIMYGKKKNNDG